MKNNKKVTLEFESPIVALRDKLADLKKIAEENDMTMDAAIKKLESQILKEKKKVFSNLNRWQKVQLSRHPDRPYTLDYIEGITDEFHELYGDRNFKDDKAIIGGIGSIGGKKAVIIGHQKGRNTKARQFRNFGMPNPEGYRKALRIMKLAAKFGIPIVSLIDTPGAYPGLEAEERGQGEAIAKNLYEMTGLEVPVICIVIGEGASGGALGIGLGDKIYQLENTWYSVISPESCSSILWRTWDKKADAAEALKLTAQDNLELGIIDGIIKEPLGGAHYNPEMAFNNVKKTILADIKALSEVDPQTRILNRIEKFENMGKVGKGKSPAAPPLPEYLTDIEENPKEKTPETKPTSKSI